MKSLINCRSLIGVAVMMVVIALMASQMTDTYAGENRETFPPTPIKAPLNQHDTAIKDAIAQHDTDVRADIDTHDDNMTNEHQTLADDHVVLEDKLDRVINGSGGDCTDCPDAWSKVIPDANDRFELVMGGVGVLDRETCLVWEQSPDTTTRTWASARLRCFQSEVGGRGGWRLPTIEELASLKDSSQSNPVLPSGYDNFFSDVQSWDYWSGTTFAPTAPVAWRVFFGNGDVGSSPKHYDHGVWCVRGGQGHDGQ